MKKIKFLAMALAALTIVSCSKENDAVDNLVPESAATVTVKITGEGNQVAGNQVGSRAAGETGAEDVKVNNYIVFLFNKDGGIVGEPTYVGNTTAEAKIVGTTAATKIYIVANTGAIADSPLKDVNSEAKLKAATGKLIADDASTQTKTNLWMAGSENVGPFTPGADATKPSTAAVTVPLSFVAAKIDVVVIDARTNNNVGDDLISIKDDQVALLFAGADGAFFKSAADQAVQSAFFSGITGYADQTSGTTQADILADAVTTPFGAGGKYHFYTFGNDGTTMPTILTIKSTKTDKSKGDPQPVYFPIRFSTTDAGYTIVPGQQYLVTLTLKGDINGGGGGGTTDPEEELKSADITVTVTPASWKPLIEVDKEFN